MSRRIGFIGSGQMARALARGFVAAGQVAAGHLLVSDALPAARDSLAAELGCQAAPDNPSVAYDCQVLVLAVKPQVIDGVLDELRRAVTTEHLVISIAAGVPIRRLAERLGADRRLIRVMPNTPCLVGASASGVAIGGVASQEDGRYVVSLFESVGLAVLLPEGQLDAVTGLSGSGPAYVYQMIEALADGGVLEGLPRPTALRLAAQTVLGAARMVLETGKHPAELKDMVASPGGTTIAGLAVLERCAVRSAFLDAVHAATARSRELGGATGSGQVI